MNVRKGKSEFVRIAKRLESLDVELKYKDTNNNVISISNTPTVLDCIWTALYGDATNFIRFIVFQWFPPSVPSIANILLTASGNGVIANYGEPYQGRYAILYDSGPVAVNSVGTPNYGSGIIRVKPKRKKVNYDPGATTGNNHIYTMIVSDSSTASHPAVNYTTSIWFNDA